jgi:hypothetical protein
MRSKDILLQAKGNHLGRVHSDQMVLQMIRWRSLVQKGHSSAEAKSSKLGLKELSDYYFSEIAVEAARREASGLNKNGYSHRISTQRERVGQQL